MFDIQVSSINRGGAAPACANTFGRARNLNIQATAMGPDGTFYLTGTALSNGFPVTAGALQTQPEPNQPTAGFLMRLDPCGSVRFATLLPGNLFPILLAVAADGSAFVATTDRGAPRQIRILHLDAAGRRILAQTDWPGIAGGLAVDARGRLHVAGTRNGRAIVVRFDPSLTRLEYETVIESEKVAYAAALAIEPDGSLFLAGGTYVGPGQIAEDTTGATAAGSFTEQAAMLARLTPQGAVIWRKNVDLPTSSGPSNHRIPFGVDVDSQGIVWVATFGSAGFPEVAEVSNRTVQLGTRLIGWNRDGTPAGASFFVPGLPLGAKRSRIAFHPSGRLAIGSDTSSFPVTPGALNNPTGNFSLISFDRSRRGAPSIQVDREVLDLGIGLLFGKRVSATMPVSFATTDGSTRPFTAAILSDGSYSPPVGTPSALRLSEVSGTLPGSLSVTSVANATGSRVVIVLAPGAQGVSFVPVRTQNLIFGLGFTRSNELEADAPGQTPLTTTMTVYTRSLSNDSGEFQVPFSVRSEAPWLQVDRSSGVMPTSLLLTADTSNLSVGIHTATLRFEIFGTTVTQQIGVRIGAFPRLLDYMSSIRTAEGRTVTQTFTIDSLGRPFDFTLSSDVSWMKLSPASGRTPAEVTMTATPPPGRAIGDPRPAKLTLEFDGRKQDYNLVFPLAYPTDSQLPDSVGPRSQLGPGALFSFTAGGLRCEAGPASGLPWPTTRGGCTLRLNGTELPIGRIGIEYLDGPYNNEGYTVTDIRAQMPYRLPQGPFVFELEDKAGARKSVRVEETSAGVPLVNASLQPVTATPGQEVTIRVSGIGMLNGEAPVGDVPTSSLSPIISIRPAVGGRPARLISAELSRTEVGIILVKVEVPHIGPGLHRLTVSIGEVIYFAGSVSVPPPSGLTALQNSASYTTNTVTPGGIVTLYGANLGPTDIATFNLDASQRIPTRLAGTRVFFNGIPSPLLYTSASQVSAIAPFDLAGQTATQVTVESTSGVAGSLLLPVQPTDPGLYSLNQSGTGPGATLNQDGSINTPNNPAAPGTVVVLFGAGFGPTDPQSQAGQLTPTVNPPAITSPVAVTIGGINAVVEYAGPAPGAVAGLYQVNARIPPEAPAGNLPVKVTVGGASSQNGITVAVAPK